MRSPASSTEGAASRLVQTTVGARWIVLVLAFVFESISCSVAWKTFKRGAGAEEHAHLIAAWCETAAGGVAGVSPGNTTCETRVHDHHTGDAPVLTLCGRMRRPEPRLRPPLLLCEVWLPRPGALSELDEREYMGEEIGWQDLTRTVAGTYDNLPAEERAHTVILTGNYGEAGALERYGEALGLPAAYSGQNNFHLWGPPPEDATTVIVVGFYDRKWVTPYFDDVERAATISNQAGVDNEEDGLPIWVARGLKRPWAEMWPDLQHYD